MSDINGTVEGPGIIDTTVDDGGTVRGTLSSGILRIVQPSVNDYEMLVNHPYIESVELVGDRRLSEFGVTFASNIDVIRLFS